MGLDMNVEERVIESPPVHGDGHGSEKKGFSVSDPIPVTEEKDAEPTFDVGIKAWSQVVGAFFVFFNSWGIINTWGAFQTYYEQELLHDVSASSIAWIGSLQSFLLMLFGVVTGPLFDAGYLRALLSFGTIMLPLGLMMTSLSTQFWQLILAQGVCIGLAAGCLFVPAVAVLPQYFKKRRGLANGIAATGSSIGGVIYPILFNQLQKTIGFPWAVRTLGFFSLATCFVSLSLLEMRFMPQERRKLVQLSAFKELPYVLCCFAMFMGFLGFYNFLVYIQAYAIDTGIVGENLGFYLLSMLNAASTFGRITPNFIADHTGPINMLTPAAIMTCVLAFIWIAVHDVPGIIILSILYGFFSGGFVSLPPVVMISLTRDLRDLGTRLGMLFSIVSVALLIGTPIGGAILSSTGSYLGVQLFTACCLAVAGLCFVCLRLSRTGLKLRVRA
ncbi:hypothetical protein ASPZODRAFT_141410 [Penicilliopsis zonata CBS 506.65]|uniref:Major facilitator superfamily (MFS) profile domain-containing protein n=1 Tax=Penicilliopsis zonata CBS 506.65 TaxID=1073090 RepID=A0A1L9SKT0_9EURO|nr:hypothetical protein ASPZODRAFT_141410 [Penicilliopsis zonata CBS 506.65]OJJ47842.1 hypothetical protein ASPZODRAFT_141410 [Penicilliopsis zonata CBS 506.65]